MLHAVTLLVLALAGVAAGGVNAVAGGGSLISFPALLALGYSPIVANVTNGVATVPGYAGGSLGYSAELRGQGRNLTRYGVVSGLGAVAGSGLSGSSKQCFDAAELRGIVERSIARCECQPFSNGKLQVRGVVQRQLVGLGQV